LGFVVIMNDEGMRHLLQDKFQIGGEAAAAAGPVGRHAEAGTDWKIESQMPTYSRSKGLFVGIDLGGSVVERDEDSTRVLYGRDLTNAQILDGKITAPVEARSFLAEVRRAKAVAVKKGS
jgi:lipid-binding SYLF domain-containing protein